MTDSDATSKPTTAAEVQQVAEEKVDTSNNPEPTKATPETGPAEAETELQQEAAQHEDADSKPEEALATSNPTEEDGKAAPDSSAGQGNSKMLKTKAKVNRQDFRKNRKFDPSVRRITDDPEEIRKQVEFYFGDWNFPQDKFMWESCGGAANKPIPISTIHSFKRMRCFQPYSAVVTALRQSNFLDVDGEEGQESVKRKVAYKSTAEAKAKAEASSVYVKGFGDEDPNTQFDLESFFAKFGEVRGLKLRRTNDGLFKGSVFVTFPDEEAAKQFIELQPAPTYKGHELKIMSKRAYCEEKSELIRQGKLQPNPIAPKRFFEGHDGTKRMPNGRGGGGGGGGGGGKRGQSHGARESGDYKRQRTKDQKHGFNNRRGRGGWRGGRGRDHGSGARGGSRDKDDDARNAEHRDDTNDVKPRIQSTTDQGEGNTSTTTANNKRTREDDGSAQDGPPAKKVDTKGQVEAEA